jgi:hypothetical protein
MTNNAAGLHDYLVTALRDTTYATWATDEMDDLIRWSVRRLFPRFARPFDGTSASASGVTLTALTYSYALPTDMLAVSRIDLYNSDGELLGPVDGHTWEVTGYALNGAGKLHISPQIVDNYVGGSVRCHGYGAYSLSTAASYITDDFVPLVLARARAEAYRRVGADRERFKAWLARNQSQNVSINELLQMINEADNEVLRLERDTARTYMKPMAGRVG